MHLLNIITITSAGLMVGNELSVSAFVNPALRRLESGPQAQALSVLARSLGRGIPVWYGLCLALLSLESSLHLHQATLAPLLSRRRSGWVRSSLALVRWCPSTIALLP